MGDTIVDQYVVLARAILMQLKRRPTMRALDAGESATFSGIFLAASFFCSQAESTLRPLAGNANRWATKCKICSPSHVITKSLELSREA